jgi:hypothetical protein
MSVTYGTDTCASLQSRVLAGYYLIKDVWANGPNVGRNGLLLYKEKQQKQGTKRRKRCDVSGITLSARHTRTESHPVLVIQVPRFSVERIKKWLFTCTIF